MSGDMLRRQDVIRSDARIVTEEDLQVMRIEGRMFPILDSRQSAALHDVLTDELVPKWDGTTPEEYTEMFCNAKSVEGCSPRTIAYYRSEVVKALRAVDKPVQSWTASDVRTVVSSAIESGASHVTANNKLRVMSSFFAWLEDEDIIVKSPVRKVKSVRGLKQLKEPFSDLDMEAIRGACRTPRERMVIELLVSSGMRVGELANLPLSRVDVDGCRITVVGKGAKVREVSFSSAAQFHMRRYLDGRSDYTDFLIVSSKKIGGEFRPMQVGGIESMVRAIGHRSGVMSCHPHRFRRTFATNAIRRGMPVEQVKELMGHESINTTMIYARVDHDNAMINAKRLIG